MKKILFIINSKAGTKNNFNIQEKIEFIFNGKIECDFLYWDSPNQYIVKDIKTTTEKNKYDVVASIGGDGTMNKVATALLYTSIPLLIVPLGSGNGLARHLDIPMNWRKALELIHTGKTRIIDSGTVNNQSFFCTSGIGFDAYIGQLFTKASKRGFITYTQLTLRELLNYTPRNYTIDVDGINHHIHAFLITIANANQWGNNVFIAPMASVSDGLLHIVALKPFKLWQVPLIAINLLTKNVKHNKQFIVLSGKQIKITREEEDPIHYDGDPNKIGKEIEYKINPQSLTVLVPK